MNFFIGLGLLFSLFQQPEPADVYTFDREIVMEMTGSKDAGGNAVNTEITMLINTSANYMGMKMKLGEQAAMVGGAFEMTIIDSNCKYNMFMNMNGSKVAMQIDPAMFMGGTPGANLPNDAGAFTKTTQTKTIAGYSTTLYKCKTDDGEYDVWVAALDFNWNLYCSIGGFDMEVSKNWGTNHMALEVSGTSKGTAFKMEAKSIKTISQTFDASGYSGMPTR